MTQGRMEMLNILAERRRRPAKERAQDPGGPITTDLACARMCVLPGPIGTQKNTF